MSLMQISDHVSYPSLPVTPAILQQSRYGGRTFEVLTGIATLTVVGLGWVVLGMLKVVKLFYKTFFWHYEMSI